MTGAYREKKEISYYTTNHRLMLTKANLAMFLQDLAINHSASLGYTLDYLADLKKGWVITNWHIEFLRTPMCGEKITLNTWSDGCKSLMANRSYLVSDENGDVIIKAASKWVFMDLEERKPFPIPEEMKERYKAPLLPAIENEKFKMAKKPERECDYKENVIVSRSQTDSNGHTNNTQYIAWAMDQVPDFIYDSMNGYDMKVVYRHESYRGTNMVMETYVDKTEDNEYVVDTYFVNGSDSSVIHSQVTTLWKNAV